ncbi:hypothetical protein ACFY36_30595 [Actinoplanes sp. NPDC000266]
MVDPLSLAALTAAVLTQGIGFVYSQAGELLRRRRERRKQADSGRDQAMDMPQPAEGHEALDGDLGTGPVSQEALDRDADQLAALRGLLQPYADGDRPADVTDRQLLEQLDAARLLLERIYQRHITFKGERRPPTGTALVADAGDVARYARQVIASGERAVAIGGDVVGGSITTGDSATSAGVQGARDNLRDDPGGRHRP